MANSALAIAGTAVFGCAKQSDSASSAGSETSTAPAKPIGLQLYTLRDVIKTDVKGIMTQLTEWARRMAPALRG